MKNNYSLVALKRWSCKTKEIPGVAAVKAIHVYDFDNTLFSSAQPNPQLWHPSTCGLLQTYEVMVNGGWWHEPAILASTGEGIEVEEPRAWEGWWNETIVQLVESSMQSKDVVSVMLTGRGETRFAELINKMCDAKKLDFDLVVLKPEVGPANQRFPTTLDFKQEFFKELIFTYKNADEIRVYEDRPKHVKNFREHFEKLNKSLLSHRADEPAPPRKPITAEVIHVCELKSNLNPEAETLAIQKAINHHNETIKAGGPNPCGAPERLLQIKENFVYFGYLINQNDSARLITLCNTSPHLIDSGEVKYMASNILIAPFYPRQDTLDKVGGRGKKVTWQVNGVAKFEDRIWAARVAPVSDTQVYTQDPTHLVVLAIRKGARPIDAAKIQNWQPVAPEKQFIFETVVGDRIILKIEELDEEYSRPTRGRNRGNGNKRKHVHEDENATGTGNNINISNNNNNNQNFRNSDRHGQGRHFGKRDQFSNRRGGNNNNSGNNNNGQQGSKGGQQGGYDSGAGRNNRRGGGQGGRQRGGNRNNGPPGGYKSLDDYGPGQGFDGASDQQGGASMVMNY